ncbi:MAG TPA: peptide MFS transporter [Humisphaera sp.]|jgi:POT family proton-dependent oligopeptide transporter|nr:peptide MFS transporter [Humisphaera sp.]
MTASPGTASLDYASPPDRGGIGGQPRGLTTLFFTEMWERFSFYGMKAILVLYTAAAISVGGLGFDNAHAGRIVGLYTSSVYLTPLIGGWIADRLLGMRLAVLIGGIVIACGHFSMACHSITNFYAGLVLIALGTGLLKPNISSMVGQLYPQGDPRRDAGFSIFYMGINLGALIAPLVCGFLAQAPAFKNFLSRHGMNPNNSWHWGFAAAGVGMIFGLVQYVMSGGRLKEVGARPKKARPARVVETTDSRNSSPNGQLNSTSPNTRPEEDAGDALSFTLAAVGAAIGVAVCFICGNRIHSWLDIVPFLLPAVLGIAFGYLIGVSRHLSRQEMGRVGAIFILFVFSTIFWMSFEQAGTSLNLFADRLTRTTMFGYSFPSSWFQAVQPAFVILLAPVFAWIWITLGKRDLSSPAKFAIALVFAGLAFALVTYASALTRGGTFLVSPWWLVGVYLLQTYGELCLSPVGLSTITKLSPGRLVGLMMGVWFLSTSLGDRIAGMVLTFFDEKDPRALVTMFGSVTIISFVAASILFLLVPLIKKMIATPAAGQSESA